MKRSTFVFDTDIPPFMANRIFDAESVRPYPGAEALASLGARLREAGMETVTADVYLGGPDAGRPAVCLSNEITRFTDDLLAFESVVPVACMSLESPLVAMGFYKRLAGVSHRFRHLFLWPGMRGLAGGTATFHDISWPYPSFEPLGSERPWAERHFLVLVSSNKRIFVPPSRYFEPRHPRRSAKRMLAAWQVVRSRAEATWVTREIYEDRLDAIRHFSRSCDFDLYGRDWSDTTTLSKAEAAATVRSYRGELPPLGKVAKLAEYKFVLCFENTAFKGYVTEKIFDCFAAGSIPIYRGAPDIKDLVPANAFIDASDFCDYDSLEAHMRRLTPQAVEGHLAAAAEFLRSERAERFTQASFVRQLSGVLLEAAGQDRPGSPAPVRWVTPRERAASTGHPSGSE